MNKIACILTAALVLASGISYGQNTSKTTTNKQSKTHRISDKAMAGVTAAGEEQESVAADHSTITENNTGAVNLSGSALMGASGVNITNESDSLVGNSANVADYSKGNDIIALTQASVITQTSRTEASLKGYKHGPDRESSKVTSSDDTENSNSEATLNASKNHSETENNSDTTTNVVTSSSNAEASNTHNDSDTKSSSSNSTENGNDTNTSASTSSTAMSLQGGKSTNSGNSTATNSTSSAGNTSSSNDTASHSLSTEGPALASNGTSNSASTDVDAKTHASQSSETKTSSSTITSSLVKNDSATHNTTDTDNETENTVETLAWTKHDTKSSHKVNNSTIIDNVQGPVSLDSASAQNIAVDNSTITATNNYSVTLAGTAEENAKAVNIANAAGGQVANAANVARMDTLHNLVLLTQANVITQTR